MNQLLLILSRFGSLLVGSLLLYAGVYKLLFPTELTAALITIGFPDRIASSVVVALTILELHLGVILVLKINLRSGIRAATALILMFSIFLSYLCIMADPPSCGCMGLAGVFHSNRHNALLGLLRNCVALWLLKGAHDYYFPNLERESGLL